MGVLEQIPNAIMVLGMAAFLGAAILISLQQFASNSLAGNASVANTPNASIQAAITAIGSVFTSWYSLLITIIVVGIVITIMYFSFKGTSR